MTGNRRKLLQYNFWQRIRARQITGGAGHLRCNRPGELLQLRQGQQGDRALLIHPLSRALKAEQWSHKPRLGAQRWSAGPPPRLCFSWKPLPLLIQRSKLLHAHGRLKIQAAAIFLRHLQLDAAAEFAPWTAWLLPERLRVVYSVYCAMCCNAGKPCVC